LVARIPVSSSTMSETLSAVSGTTATSKSESV
jgi:hypothetical protein